MKTQRILLSSRGRFWAWKNLEEQHCTTLNHPTNNFKHKGTSLVLSWARCTDGLAQYIFLYNRNDWVSSGMWTALQWRMRKKNKFATTRRNT